MVVLIQRFSNSRAKVSHYHNPDVFNRFSNVSNRIKALKNINQQSKKVFTLQ